MVLLKSALFGLLTAFAAAFLWISGEVVLVGHRTTTAPTVASTPAQAPAPAPTPSTTDDFKVTTTVEVVSVSTVEVTRTFWPIAWCAGLVAGFYWMFRRQRTAS